LRRKGNEGLIVARSIASRLNRRFASRNKVEALGRRRQVGSADGDRLAEASTVNRKNAPNLKGRKQQ